MKSQFETLGWGAVPNPEHDLGTDLWLMARDARRFDLGALVGVQVKTGDSYFSEPEIDEDKVVGWWYRDDDKHFDYWTEHTIPHLLVLYDQAEGSSYWVHVTRDKVVSTGKDSKILVDASTRLDSSSLEALLAVAASRPNVKSWEGTAWHIGHDIPVSSQLRYALITPRLVAPHPNSTVTEVTAAQAIALLVQMRLHDVDRYLGQQPLLNPRKVTDSDDLSWRLYASLHDWVVRGEIEGLIALNSSVGADSERAAVAVCLANAFYEAGRPADSLELLDKLIEEDVLNPVDDGWLHAHRTRCAVEVGDLAGARAGALKVHTLRHIAPSDPTARALSGAAALVIVNLGDFRESGIADAIQSGDNLASWWRSQAFVSALSKQADQNFKEWGNDTSFTIGAEDVVGNRLRSTTLIAGFIADSSSWRQGAVLLAQHNLMAAGGNEKRIFGALVMMLRAGVHKDLKLAVSKFVDVGPLQPVIEVAEQLDLRQSTRSSLKADLIFIKTAADILPEEICDKNALWALETLADIDNFIARLQPGFFVAEEIVEVLAALVVGVSESVRERVVDHVVNLPSVTDQLTASRYGRLIRRVDVDWWSTERLRLIAERPEDDNFELREAIDDLVASRDETFRLALVERITNGDLSALNSYGNVTDLPGAAARGMIIALTERVTERTVAARRGEYGFGGDDVLHALALLNIWHPEQAQWEACLAALEEPKSHGDHIVGTIRAIGSWSSKVPADILERLRDPLEAISSRDPSMNGLPDLFGGRSDARGAAAFALSQLYPELVTTSALTGLLCGGTEQREAAVRIVGLREDSNDFALLAALSTDPDNGVRSAVAYFLARWIVNDIEFTSSRDLLKELLSGGGVTLAVSARRVLLEDTNPDNASALIEILEDSPSALVRAAVERTKANQ